MHGEHPPSEKVVQDQIGLEVNTVTTASVNVSEKYLQFLFHEEFYQKPGVSIQEITHTTFFICQELDLGHNWSHIQCSQYKFIQK